MVKMRIFNPSVAFVFVMVITGSQGARGTRVLKHRQSAVFSLVGSENFYVEMKKKIPVTYVHDGQRGHLRDYDYSYKFYMDYDQNENSNAQQIPTEDDQSKDLNDKSVICSFIFDSPFFDARGEVAVNYDLTQTGIMDELRESKRNTYDDIYGDYPNAEGQWLNPYKPRTVVVGGERFEEQTFRCLTRRRDSTTSAADSYAYVDYFVSPIYLSKRPKDLVMNGRFVFTTNKDNELVLIATAEERVGRVERSRIKSIQKSYNEKKRKHLLFKQPKPDETSNVLCTLTVRDRIRLCDSVINLPNFPDEVSFFPDEANVTDKKCEEIRVSGEIDETKVTPAFLSSKWIHRTVTTEITYDQWMLGCKVIGTKGNSLSLSSWYYISPGLFSNGVEVFKVSASKNVYSAFVAVDSIFWAERVYDDVLISSKVIYKSNPFLF